MGAGKHTATRRILRLVKRNCNGFWKEWRYQDHRTTSQGLPLGFAKRVDARFLWLHRTILFAGRRLRWHLPVQPDPDIRFQHVERQRAAAQDHVVERPDVETVLEPLFGQPA